MCRVSSNEHVWCVSQFFEDGKNLVNASDLVPLPFVVEWNIQQFVGRTFVTWTSTRASRFGTYLQIFDILLKSYSKDVHLQSTAVNHFANYRTSIHQFFVSIIAERFERIQYWSIAGTTTYISTEWILHFCHWNFTVLRFQKTVHVHHHAGSTITALSAIKVRQPLLN